MASSNALENKKHSQSVRYEGLDAFRVISSFYVVFGHVYLSCGSLPELKPFLRAVTFSFPFIVMSSFFVLTRALIAKPEIKFGQFFINSTKRLWIPFFVWTVIYSLTWSFIFPAIRGHTSFVFPPLTRLLSGYMHLWFLEFLFIGSLFLYFILRWSRNRKVTRRQLVVLCLFLTVLSEFLFNILFHPDRPTFTMADVLPEADSSLNVLIRGTVINFFFVLPAICLALYADDINNLFEKRIFRILSLAVVFIYAVVHMSSTAVPYSREIYTLAVFTAALQPWKFPYQTVRFIATYSYAIYILHFMPVELLSMIARYEKVEFTSGFVLAWSIIIYLASLATAILLRKLFPWNWFLPLVPVGYQKNPQ